MIMRFQNGLLIMILHLLITRNATEEDEAYAAFVDEEDDKTGNKIVDEIENVLDKNPNPIDLLDELSMKFIEGFSKLIETDFEIVDKPLIVLV